MIPIVIPAMMICLIIGLVLSVVSRFAFHWLGGKLTGYINSEFGGQFGRHRCPQRQMGLGRHNSL